MAYLKYDLSKNNSFVQVVVFTVIFKNFANPKRYYCVHFFWQFLKQLQMF